jgi:hypothetical protein
MSKKTAKQIVFFILLYLLYYVSVSIFLSNDRELDTKYVLISGAIYTGLVALLFYIGKMSTVTDNYKAFTLPVGATCMGGSYMHQGDSAEALRCQELLKTPEGRNEIAQFNCPTGYIGQPGRNRFTYSSDSGDQWQNTKNEPTPHYVGNGNDLCSMGDNF